jgi:glucose-1-phosphate cytidylyltransferase
VIKKYFINYDESLSNDFIFEKGGKSINLLHRDIDDWRITFVDTGMTATIAERLLAVKPHLEGDEVFMANYSDGLTDCPLPDLVDAHKRSGAVASFLCIKPHHSFHVVEVGANNGTVVKIQDTIHADFWVNGGYFVLNKEIFDYIKKGDELVNEPFQRLITESKLHAHKYTGFWGCMDTFKEKQMLDDLYDNGLAPWISEHENI